MNYTNQVDLPLYSKAGDDPSQVAPGLHIDQLNTIPEDCPLKQSRAKQLSPLQEFTASPPYLGDCLMSGRRGSANGNVEDRRVSSSQFETQRLHVDLSYDQQIDFPGGWRPLTNGLEQCPNASEFMNGSTARKDFDSDSLSSMSETTWTNPAEHRTQMLETNCPHGQQIVDPKTVVQDNQACIRLIMESPAVETTKAVIEAILNARGKMSMEVDTASTVT